MPRSWHWIATRQILIGHQQYYEVYFKDTAGDIFRNWREAEGYKKKLFAQLTN